jgi:hypothetical protein
MAYEIYLGPNEFKKVVIIGPQFGFGRKLEVDVSGYTLTQ